MTDRVVLIPVVLIGWSAACALTRWRLLGPIARIPAQLTSELPFLAAYLLIASSVLALTRSGLQPVGAMILAVLALLVLLALAVIVRQALRADAALDNPRPLRRPWRRILTAPLPASRRGIVRVPDLAYGEGKQRRLDVYHHRDRPTGVPVVLHLHGGAFRGGDKRREAQPLIGHLTSRGMVCVSADYGLLPHVGYPEQLADVLAAVEWVRAHAEDYGGDPELIFLVGSSAGAYLAVEAVNAGAQGMAGVVGRYGFYGILAPEVPFPPVLLIHGQNDLLVPPPHARAFAERMRKGSARRVEYVELPGAAHSFDLFESIRAHAVGVAVERFIDTGVFNAREGHAMIEATSAAVPPRAGRQSARQAPASRRRGGHAGEEREVAQGKVKWFNETKGYGFIGQDDGSDVFVHVNSLAPGVRTLSENQVVEFEVEQGKKGPQAANVRPV